MTASAAAARSPLSHLPRERTGYAHVTEAVRAGAVFVPFVKLADSAANFLTNSFDPASKIPEYKVCAVRIEPVRS
jgi:predicted molibdopterin-dependent oxidoreductase YjgC